MKRYLAYLRYLLKHRRYVREFCFERKIYWRGLTHDLSKFLPSEFFPYAQSFYNEKGEPQEWQEAISFDLAWLSHQKRNEHHWQFWCLLRDSGEVVPLPMSELAVAEMVCDWMGAGKAIREQRGKPSENPLEETREWYFHMSHKMKLHPETRRLIEKELKQL